MALDLIEKSATGVEIVKQKCNAQVRARTDEEVSDNTELEEEAKMLASRLHDCTCWKINTATHPSRFGEERGSLAVEIYGALRRANPLRPLSPEGARCRDGLLRSLAQPRCRSRVRWTPAPRGEQGGFTNLPRRPQIRLRLFPELVYVQVVAQRGLVSGAHGAYRPPQCRLAPGRLNGCSGRSAGGHCTQASLRFGAAFPWNGLRL